MPHAQGEPGCADRWGYEEAAVLFERRAHPPHDQPLHRAGFVVYGGTAVISSGTRSRRHHPSAARSARRSLSLLGARHWRVWRGHQGWLDPDEAELLAIGLAAFSSATPTSPSEMTLLRRLFEYCVDSGSEYTQHLAHIKQFMTMLEQAIALRRGVLWGRDLRLFYQQSKTELQYCCCSL